MERPQLAAERGEHLAFRPGTRSPYYPHCDLLVLHAPDDCEYCAMPEFYALHLERVGLDVSYTGGDLRRWRCPSELRRPLETIERWPGNRPNLVRPPRASSPSTKAAGATPAGGPTPDIDRSIPVSGSRYDLDQLLKKALESYEAMTPLEKLRHREEQRVSWAYGNLAMSTRHRVSLRQVRRAALEMWLDALADGDIKAWIKLFRRLESLGLDAHALAWAYA